jgi:mannose-6-phosphate isomerase-like protein (cupin superfamily)
MSSQPYTSTLPIFSSPNEVAEWFEPLPGERMRVRIGSEATGGRLTVLENVVAPGAAAPMHFHYDADELFIVLSGQFRVTTGTVTTGTQQIDAGPGSAVFAPQGAAHAFVNPGTTEARLLSIFVPGGMEAMFKEASRARPDKIPALAARHRTVLLGVPFSD